MARYIDAEMLKKKAYPFPCAIGVEYAVSLRQIDEAPTADVKEVVRGKWGMKADGGIYCMECDAEKLGIFDEVCAETHYLRYNFCHNCGADMREGEQCSI